MDLNRSTCTRHHLTPIDREAWILSGENQNRVLNVSSAPAHHDPASSKGLDVVPSVNVFFTGCIPDHDPAPDSAKSSESEQLLLVLKESANECSGGSYSRS